MGFLTRALSCSVCVVLPTVVLASSLLFSWIMFVQHSHKVATVLPISLPVCESSVTESGIASVFCTAQRHTHELFQQHLASCEHYHQFQALAFQAGSTLMNQMEQALPGTTQEELAVTTCVTILTAIFFSWAFCVYMGRKMMSKRPMKKHVSWDEASFLQHGTRFEKEEEEKDHFIKEEVFGDVSDCVDSPQHMEEVLQLKQIIEKTQKKMGDLLQENGDLKIQLATRSPRLQESPEAAIVKLEAQVQELLNLKETLSEYKGCVSQVLETLNQNESKYEKTLKELEERITQHRELNHYLEEAKTQVLKEIQQIKDALAGDDEQQNNASKQESVVTTTQVVAPKVSTPRDTSKLKKTFLSKFKLIDDTPQASNNTVADSQAQSQDNAPQKIEEEQHTETQSQSQEQQVTAVQQIDSLVTQLEEALAFEATKTEDEQTATQQEEEENASILLNTSTVDTSDLVGVDSPMGCLNLTTTTTTTDSNVDEDVDSFLAASPVRDSSANEVPVLEVVAPVVEKDSPAEQTHESTDVQTSVVQESSKSSNVETDETETAEQTL